MTEEIAWAAGLFEGEGCIRLQVQGAVVSISLDMNMTDADVMQRFVEIVGSGSLCGPYTHKQANYKPFYRWHIAKFAEVERLLIDFWPYLGERRRVKAKEALDAYRSVPHVQRGKYRQLVLF